MFSKNLKSNDNKVTTEVSLYDILIRSLPDSERNSISKELDSKSIIQRAELLHSELLTNTLIGLNLEESRTLFLAALRNLKNNKISAAQLATIHIFDSAIRTLYTNPLVYMIHKFVTNNQVNTTVNVFALQNLKGMPTTVRMYKFNILPVPYNDFPISDLPHRMQKPLMQRYFNFSNSEWNNFCNEMNQAPTSEQFFKVLIAPTEGCYSSIIARIEKVLKCMRTLDWEIDSEEGMLTENIILVPSFTMFQSALNVKAMMLNRKPVELTPTYGYIDDKYYHELKSSEKIAFTLYMPEVNPNLRYRPDAGRFRTTIDGHPNETAFAGALHDMYHALREMAMSENVAKARMRLISIAKNHPNNKRTSTSQPVDNILIDGELIFSYPPSLDTTFDPEHRPLREEKFGELFYTSALRFALHDNLKRAFIEDMVINESLWKTEFNIGKADLRTKDKAIFDEIKLSKTQTSDVSFSNAKAISQMGLLPNISSTPSVLSSTDTPPRPDLPRRSSYSSQ